MSVVVPLIARGRQRPGEHQRRHRHHDPDPVAESDEARERLAWQLKHAAPVFDYEKGKPSKKERRELGRLRDRD